ncbi:MAG: hypothetical protein JXR70_05890 [Spirochaetales bacterium]|nr:hypothetical protein [Spirochaetales bacterium]
MRHIKKIGCILLLSFFFFISCVETSEKGKEWDNSFLYIDKLSYKGLPLITTEKRLVDILGEPDAINTELSIQPSESGSFGDEIECQVYIYYVGVDGLLCFWVYNNQAIIYRIDFSDPRIILDYKYGSIQLSRSLNYQQASTLFSAASGTITGDGKTYQTLTFNTNSRSKISTYATPILTFSENNLSHLFYYPEFY